jgi:predicted negative regulator of RcsB-dependent stress response
MTTQPESCSSYFGSRLENSRQNEKLFESLLAKSSILIQNGDYQSARQVPKKAYKSQTPNTVDKEAIQIKLKAGEFFSETS